MYKIIYYMNSVPFIIGFRKHKNISEFVKKGYLLEFLEFVKIK